jgi:hypothetical protein
VLMSGYAKDPIILEPERYGFKGALTKPFQIEELREVLAQVLGTGKSEESSVISHQK